MSPSPAQERAAVRAHLADLPIVRVEVDDRRLALTSAWGLFSPREVDGGTALLLRELAALPPQGQVLDWGCGYGVLGLALAAGWPQARVTLVDKDVVAVEAARANIAATGLRNAEAWLSPGLRDAPPGPYDLIVSNVPAQAGNEALDQILLDAYDHLQPGGSLVVVSVNGLRRYLQRRMLAIFGAYHKAHQGPHHTVAQAVRETIDA